LLASDIAKGHTDGDQNETEGEGREERGGASFQEGGSPNDPEGEASIRDEALANAGPLRLDHAHGSRQQQPARNERVDAEGPGLEVQDADEDA
jgi:hypothetical protein